MPTAPAGVLDETRRPRLLLASRSPRRRELLHAHGYDFDTLEPAFDDAGMTPGLVDPATWVMALAFLKASAARPAHPDRDTVLLGADTVCVKGDHVLGQPADGADARCTLLLLRDGEHEVLTGVALLCPRTGRRATFCDRARVSLGPITDADIDAYIASEHWRGKAGAYNLAERLEAGWPIRYEGDPTSIMGLPMQALAARFAAFCAEG